MRIAAASQAVTPPRAAIVAHSVTTLGPAPRGRVALAASHGGLYAAYLAAKAGLAGVILCDAGVGRDRAGIAGLDTLQTLDMPAAAIGHRTARIGDGADCLARGRITFANACAIDAGVTIGMPARAALDSLAAAGASPCPAPPPQQEARHRIEGYAQVTVVALDSNALVTPDDVGAIMLTGSHGGLLGGRPETAVKQAVFAAVYNDAGFGIDDAGISRLPALDARGIAGATVSAFSARIGDGMSTYRDGIVSAVNATAAGYGAEIGITAQELVRRFADAQLRVTASS